MVNCAICNTRVSSGVALSDGRQIHKGCLSKIEETYNNNRNGRLHNLTQQVRELKSKLGRKKSFIGEIISTLTNDQDADLKIRKKIIDVENEIYEIKNANKIAIEIFDYMLKYPPDWEARREDVMERDSFQCRECNGDKYLQIHHTIPLSKGGTNKINNLITLCEKCHSLKHNHIFNYSDTDNDLAFEKRIKTINQAIQSGGNIEFKYKKPTDRGYKKRVIKPTRLKNVDHSISDESTLCIEGFCFLRNQDRTFALKRMQGVKICRI